MVLDSVSPKVLTTLPTLLAVFLVAACATTAAQGQRERPRYVLKALDADQDGNLSVAELQNAPSVLRGLDRNGDGQLTPDELEAPRPDAGMSPDQLVVLLMGYDHNGDSVLTREELPERLRPMFTRGDRNHDGKLTQDEIRAMAQHAGAPNGRAGGPGSAAGIMRQDPVLNALDTDHDGVLSSAEIDVAANSLQVLDKNGDGYISADEVQVRQPSPAERVAHVLSEFDTNKDGTLSPDECPDGLRARFTAADTNHDNLLDRTELLQMFAQQTAGATAEQKGQHN